MVLIQTVEQTRVLDRIFLRYKIRLPELTEAINKYDLMSDPDIQSALKVNMAQLDQIKKQKIQEQKEENKNAQPAGKNDMPKPSIKLTKDQKDEIQATIMQQGGPIDPVQNIQGVLDFNNYSTTSRVQSALPCQK